MFEMSTTKGSNITRLLNEACQLDDAKNTLPDDAF